MDAVETSKMGAALQYVGRALYNYSTRTRRFAAAYTIPVDPREISTESEAHPTFFPLKLKVRRIAVPHATAVLESLRGGLEIDLEGGVIKEVQEDAGLTEAQVREKLARQYDGKSGGTWDPSASVEYMPGRDTYKGRPVVNINPLPMEFELVLGRGEEDEIRIRASKEGQQMAERFVRPLLALIR